MPSVSHHRFLTSCLRLQSISWNSLNRYYGNSPSALEPLTKIQELADRFPSDTCDRKVTLKDEIKRRVIECRSKSIQEIDSKFWEEECQSLLRILKNHHRDNYKFPLGLGDSSKKPGGSVIAATGADLHECRRIIIERELKQYPLLTRILTRLIR